MRRLACIVIVAGGLVAWAPTSPVDEPMRPVFERLPDLEARLEALVASEPAGYLELGEEVAAIGDARLARELLARAVVLAIKRGDARTAGSGAMALSTLIEGEEDRRWVRALAWSVEPERRWVGGAAEEAGADSASAGSADAAAMLWLYLAGEAHRARLLDSAETRAVLDATPELSHIARGTTGQLIEGLAEGWPCPSCVGQRFVSERSGDRRVYRICPHCQGDPGAKLTREQLIWALRAEMRLTGGAGGSWSAAISDGRDSVVGDPDPSELGERLGLDLSAVVWRGGRWVRETP